MTTTADGENTLFHSQLSCFVSPAEFDVCVPSALQAAHEELHTDRKPAFPRYPVVQPASDWLF